MEASAVGFKIRKNPFRHSVTLVSYTEEPGVTAVAIPAGTTAIAESAFRGCTSLQEIRIPDSVRSIGDSAFAWCSSLSRIRVPESVTSLGAGAFSHCGSLETITLPASVSAVGAHTFEECTALTEVHLPETVSSLGDYAFAACTALKEIRLPQEMDSIGERAFTRCTALQTVHMPKQLRTLSLQTFCSCTALQEMHLPAGLREIPARAFELCRSLWKLTIPEGVEEIANDAFYSCTGLQNVFLPDSLHTLRTSAFRSCWWASDLYGFKALRQISPSNPPRRTVSLPLHIQDIERSALIRDTELTFRTPHGDLHLLLCGNWARFRADFTFSVDNRTYEPHIAEWELSEFLFHTEPGSAARRKLLKEMLRKPYVNPPARIDNAYRELFRRHYALCLLAWELRQDPDYDLEALSEVPENAPDTKYPAYYTAEDAEQDVYEAGVTLLLCGWRDDFAEMLHAKEVTANVLDRLIALTLERDMVEERAFLMAEKNTRCGFSGADDMTL